MREVKFPEDHLAGIRDSRPLSERGGSRGLCHPQGEGWEGIYREFLRRARSADQQDGGRGGFSCLLNVTREGGQDN